MILWRQRLCDIVEIQIIIKMYKIAKKKKMYMASYHYVKIVIIASNCYNQGLL